MTAALAAYAAGPASSRGRQHPEPPPAYRSEYQRDRDRVIHTAAFRRLEYKTQVFVNHEGDMFRTRLTHSIEVAQIARTVARALRLNDDLSEAIALAHDLGHTPFGHAGQQALNHCLRDYGGFEHNLQSLRVVDLLEEKYPAFPGLNLTFETREGILKRCSRERALDLGDLGRRFIAGGQPTLEAQLVNLADEIAYGNHDVDDGLRAGLLTVGQLRALPMIGRHIDAIRREWPDLGERRLIHETVRRLIGEQVVDLIEASGARLAAAAPRHVDEVRAAAAPLIGFGDELAAGLRDLKRFLFEHLYRHERVRHMTDEADGMVRALFAAYMEHDAWLPAGLRDDAGGAGAAPRRVRRIADHIAGMTDRYAIAEYGRIVRRQPP